MLGAANLAKSVNGVAIGLPVLLCITALALWPGVHGPFLFDDFPNLKNLAELGNHPTWRSIGVYLSLFPGISGRPLATLSFLLNDIHWPSNPYSFKVTNVLIHLLNGVLAFGLARSLGYAMYHGRTQVVNIEFAALTCSAIWMLSPIQVSAVFLTVQRMTELAGTFALAGLWGFVAILERAKSVHQVAGALTILAVGTVLSFLCKENGALVPPLAMVACGTLLQSRMTSLPKRARRLLWLGLALPTAAVAQFLLKRILNAPDGFYTGRNFDLADRVMTESRVLIDYASLIIAPRISSSSLYNDDYVISRSLLDPATTLPAIVFVIAMAVAALWLRRRSPLFAFGVLWFLAGHLIESTVVALEIYFEHRNYVPLFGVAFAVAFSAFSVAGKVRLPALSGIALWLLLATTITHLQAKTWGDEGRLALFWHMEHPSSLRAQQHYAQYLLKSGHPDEARSVMARIQEMQQSPFDSLLQLMTLDCDSGREIAPERMQSAMALASTSRHSPGTALILARMRTSVQRHHCPRYIPPNAWLALTEETIRNPNGAGIARMLRVERAEFYLAANRLDDAIHELKHAYGRGWSAEPRVAFYAAALLATAGRYDEARAWAQRPLGEKGTWRRWLAQTDRQARELIEQIDASQREANSTSLGEQSSSN